MSDSIKLHESKKAGDRDSVMRSLEQVHKARGIYQVLKLRENEAELARVRVEKLRAAFGEHKMKTAELEKARNDAERLYDKCRRYLDECRLELDKNTARLLAKELKEGQPCPVCGSLITPRLQHIAGPTTVLRLNKRSKRHSADSMKQRQP